MKSNFKFLNYKIDSFTFELECSNKTIYSKIFEGNLTFGIALKQPMFIERELTYLGGFNCKISLEDEELPIENKTVFSLESGIIGAFSFENPLSQEREAILVKKQIPAILLPYMRGSISSFLANAGFGSIVLPLINMNAVAEQYPEVKIKNI